QELQRVLLLEVLREHEDAGIRHLFADLARRPQALVGMRRRHADVDHRDVGLVRSGLAYQLLPVASLPDHLEAGLLEQPHDTFAQQHGVFGDDHPHGKLARRVVPSSSALARSRRPSSAATRSWRPRSPEPCSGSAPPTPSSLTSTSTCPLRRTTLTVTLCARA